MKPFLNLKLLDKSKTYLVGVSFGPDSMALLHMLHTQGYLVEVAHVNYRLRTESDLEQSQLEQYCLRYDLPLHVLVVQQFPSGNVQGKAREIRYQFFKEIAEQIHAAAIVTAHHKDDDLETALIQKNRGHFHEYYGIPEQGSWQGFPVIRPLLSSSKASLLQYLSAHNLGYAIDPSNQKPKYLRNRIRLMIQAMSDQTIQKQTHQFQLTNFRISKLKETLVPYLHQHSFSIKDYLTWNQEKQFLFWLLLSRKRNFQFSIRASFLKKVMLIFQSHKPNLSIKMTDSWLIEKAYDRFWLIQQSNLQSYDYYNPKGTINMHYLTIHMDALPLKNAPYQLRSCLPTDKVKIQGYQKSFRRLAIDWKMPKFLRKIWPVFLDQNHDIVWLPRYQNKPQTKANKWLEIIE